jgi:CheY-like chemotaxis protein
MPQDSLERIFLPFERLGAEQTEVEGTGIGLPLSKALTEAMGGRLTASSALGEGSAFTVTFPRAPDLVPVVPQDVPASPVARPATPPRAAIHILYIEDNPANIEVVARFLRAWPDTTLTCETSGREGIDAAVRDVPDLVLLDIHLPDLPGDQVLNELVAMPVTAAIPVVVLSADATPGAVRRLLAHGARAYLTKPIDLAELGRLLESLTGHGQDHPDPAAAPTPSR